uniref:Uncharacterized protein n=1 Tax=Fagus sylvatica TaxID=28930 RepID=A0A2N9H9B6_FAGSY
MAVAREAQIWNGAAARKARIWSGAAAREVHIWSGWSGGSAQRQRLEMVRSGVAVATRDGRIWSGGDC